METETSLPLTLTEVLGRVREVVEGVTGREAPAVDEYGTWPAAGVRALQAAGLGGLVIPREAGGLGLGLYGVIRVCEELGRACSSTALCFGMHCVGSAVIAARATPDQRRRYLEPISRGAHLTTLALSEPGSGAHFYLPQARLRVEADGSYTVSGTKSFVTNGSMADSYVISAVADDTSRPVGEFSALVVREGLPGMEWGTPWEGLGMRGNSSRTLELRDVHIPATDLLGKEGDQIWYVFHVVAPYFLSAMAGTYLGIAAAALEEARTYLAGRIYAHSGQALGHSPVLQHRLGWLWSVVERTRRLVYYAGQEGDRGAPDAVLALISAKAEVADAAIEVVNEAMTLLGGTGYRKGSRVERLLRDVRAAHVMAPTTDILRTWAGRLLLDLPVIGE